MSELKTIELVRRAIRAKFDEAIEDMQFMRNWHTLRRESMLVIDRIVGELSNEDIFGIILMNENLWDRRVEFFQDSPSTRVSVLEVMQRVIVMQMQESMDRHIEALLKQEQEVQS